MSVRNSFKPVTKPLPPVSRDGPLKRLADVIRPGVLLQHCFNKTFWIVESEARDTKGGHTKTTYKIREITNLHETHSMSLTRVVSGFSLVSTPDDT